MNAVATTTAPALNFGDLALLADAIAKSNLFGIKTKEQALVLMMIARSEGRDPVEAARDYDIIQGKPAKKAEAMLRDFLAAGGKVEWHELSDTKADATFKHPQTGSVRIDWDLARANTAGFGGKEMWKKFPRQMLRSRVLSEGVRTLWPLATSGMYVPEEQADIPFTGTTLDAEPEAPPLRAAAAPMPRADRIAEKAPAYEAPPQPKQTIGQYLDALEIAMRDCDTLAAVNRLIASPKTVQARQTLKNGALERLEHIIAAGLAAHAPVTYPDPDDDTEALPEDERPDERWSSAAGRR